jgi:hypothetical protein
MPATVYYKGAFYFISFAELDTVKRLIEKDAPQAILKVDESGKKLAIEVTDSFEKKDLLQGTFSTAASYAADGMILCYQNNAFADVFCPGRINGFSPDRPCIILFTLREFEETFGKPDMEISQVVYDSPFYFYEISLEDIGPGFEDEIPISDEDFDTGFAILKKIWKQYVAISSTPVFPIVFRLYDGSKPGTHAVQGTQGFAPGYTLEQAIEEARECNFMVLRWDDFWDKSYVIKH